MAADEASLLAAGPANVAELLDKAAGFAQTQLSLRVAATVWTIYKTGEAIHRELEKAIHSDTYVWSVGPPCLHEQPIGNGWSVTIAEIDVLAGGHQCAVSTDEWMLLALVTDAVGAMDEVAVFSRQQEDGNIVAAELGDALPQWLTGEKPWDDYRLVLASGSLHLVSHEQLPDNELATASSLAKDGVKGLFFALHLLAKHIFDASTPPAATASASASASAGASASASASAAKTVGAGLQVTALQDLFAAGLRTRRAEALSSQSKILCILPARIATALTNPSRVASSVRHLPTMAGLRFLGLDTLELRRAVSGRSQPHAGVNPSLESLYNQGLCAVVCTVPSPVQAALARHAWSPPRSVRLVTSRALSSVCESTKQAQATAAAQIGWRMSAGLLSLCLAASDGGTQPDWLASQSALAVAALDCTFSAEDTARISGLEACLTEAASWDESIAPAVGTLRKSDSINAASSSIDASATAATGAAAAATGAGVTGVASAVASAIPAFVERQGGMQHVQVSSRADSGNVGSWEAFLQDAGPEPETEWDGGEATEWVWPQAMQQAMASGVCSDAALTMIERVIRLEPLDDDEDAGIESEKIGASTVEMDAMDVEVAASATLGGSFSGEASGDDDLPTGEEQEQLNMLASLLQSLEGQDGSSGPASALLGQLGIPNPLEWAEQARQLAEKGSE